MLTNLDIFTTIMFNKVKLTSSPGGPSIIEPSGFSLWRTNGMALGCEDKSFCGLDKSIL